MAFLKNLQTIYRDFAYYKSKENSNYPKIATLLAQDYHEVWFSEERFTDVRTENNAQVIHKSSPLKIDIARYLIEKK